MKINKLPIKNGELTIYSMWLERLYRSHGDDATRKRWDEEHTRAGACIARSSMRVTRKSAAREEWV